MNQTELDKAPVTYDQPPSYEHPSENPQPPMNEQPIGYGYPGQPNTITTQGNVSYVSPNTVTLTQGVRPPNGMAPAIFACLCCFWPTGICAIVYASQANSEENTDVAWSKYRTSRRLSIASIVVGLILIGFAIWRIVYMKSYTSQYY
ncbi:hypothetical protein ACJMK2_032967 [Sinanodonta woodiana]|uniref:Uncharacterized protein n=1 Tax=Sinanodonta woodiana TaxID=1069815 RepID=A0ABD3X779_SINWO